MALRGRVDVKRLVGLAISLLFLTGVGTGIYFSSQDKQAQDAALAESSKIETLRGLIGSEKEAFLSDPRLAAVLRKQGFVLQLSKAGSREISSRPDLKEFDFGYPAGAPGAVKLQNTVGAKSIIPTYYTVMTIASWKALIPVLEANGLVMTREGNHFIVDMRRLLDMVGEGRRWKQLKDNSIYPVGKSIMITSTDIRKSNSAAMYAALASYVLNGDNVIQSDEDIRRVLPAVERLFLRQGFQESSSAGPWEDYVSMRMGKSPLVMVYEAQYLEFQAARPQPDDEMALLYPVPTVITKHIFVPFNNKGERLGRLLADSPEIQAIAAEYGLRSQNPEHFSAYMKEKKIKVPPAILDVIDPPAYEWIEQLIVAIEQRFK